MKREAIIEALQIIQEKYINNITKQADFVALGNEISNLVEIAEKELKPNDELLDDLRKTKKNIIH